VPLGRLAAVGFPNVGLQFLEVDRERFDERVRALACSEHEMVLSPRHRDVEQASLLVVSTRQTLPENVTPPVVVNVWIPVIVGVELPLA